MTPTLVPGQPAMRRQGAGTGTGEHAGQPPASPSQAVPADAGHGPPPAAGSVAVLLLSDVHRASRWWAWSRLVLGRWPLRGTPGLQFSKVLGSGADGGFGLRPSATRQGLFLLFTDEAAARRFIESSPTLAGYRERARECCVVLLRASSCKGSWNGTTMQATVDAPVDAPIAALTRASIRPRHALAFWRLSPPAETSLANAPGCLLAAGLGEAPLLRQATFSLWSNVAAMDAYARSGAHLQAIRVAYAGDFFSESMFVRFVPLMVQGQWKGRRYG